MITPLHQDVAAGCRASGVEIDALTVAAIDQMLSARRMRDGRATAQGDDREQALRLSCLQVVGRCGYRGDPREGAALLFEYVTTGAIGDPNVVEVAAMAEGERFHEGHNDR